MKTKMNLQKKTTLLVSGIVLFIIIINTSVLTYISYNRYKTAILSKSASVGEGMQKELGKVLSLGIPLASLEGINEKLADLSSREKAIGYSMIMSKKGKILFHSDQNNVGREMRDPASLLAAASDSALVQTVDSFYDLSFPLLDADNQIVGALRLGVKSNAINAPLYQLLLWAFGASVLCFVLSIILVYFFTSKLITKPIITIEQVADKIASGDLTHTIEVRTGDEVGSLEKAINRMAFNLKDMLVKVTKMTNSILNVTSTVVSASKAMVESSDTQKKAIQKTIAETQELNHSITTVASGTGDLSGSSSEISSSIFEMSASIEKIAENSVIFSETANDTASSIEEMLASIKQITDNLGSLSTSSEEISSSISEVNATTKDIEKRAAESVGLAEVVMTNASDKGMMAANSAMEGMVNIKGSVKAISDVINVLGQKTGDIGKITSVIVDVAEQTNLLAINAAILASKAGQHGRGFAVVADEIKSLAERTSYSTSEIKELIRAIQDTMKSSFTIASDGIQNVDKGIKLVQDVTSVLGEISESSKASTLMAKAIQKATAEEAIAVRHITTAINSMTEQIESISHALQEQGKGSTFIIEAAERVKDLSAQLKVATTEQKGVSRQIAEATDNVSKQASQIAHAMENQKNNSKEIVGSMQQIQNTTNTLISSSQNMNAVISSLKAEAMNLLMELQKFRS